MWGIPGDIDGNSLSIPPEICPGVGDFPRFSVTILITPMGLYIQMTSALGIVPYVAPCVLVQSLLLLSLFMW